MPENYLISRSKALQQYETAYHLLNVTFPLIKDPKLLIGVMQNILATLEFSIDTILEYEKQLRLVPNYEFQFQSKFNMFRYKSAKRNKIPQELINLIVDLKEILEMHKKSPMAFQRGNKFVICTHDYRLHTISIDDIKQYLIKTNQFLSLTDQAIKLK
ncbi:MAG: hypothetical protein ABIH82_04800 [Candidatus Woesearchaeota archaeon]